MGHVYVDAHVSGRKSETVRFLVDTGATYMILPPSLVRRLGAVMLPRSYPVTLAGGRRRKLKACAVGVRIGKRTGPTIALVLAGADPVLGVETLEELGLKVNPTKARLEPARAHAALLVGARLGWPVQETSRRPARSDRHGK